PYTTLFRSLAAGTPLYCLTSSLQVLGRRLRPGSLPPRTAAGRRNRRQAACDAADSARSSAPDAAHSPRSPFPAIISSITHRALDLPADRTLRLPAHRAPSPAHRRGLTSSARRSPRRLLQRTPSDPWPCAESRAP